MPSIPFTPKTALNPRELSFSQDPISSDEELIKRGGYFGERHNAAHVQVSVINPAFILGPPVLTRPSGESVLFMKRMIEGEYKEGVCAPLQCVRSELHTRHHILAFVYVARLLILRSEWWTCATVRMRLSPRGHADFLSPTS